MRKSLARFRADQSGLTLIESTFIMLILISLMVTGTEVQRYFRLARHLKAAGESLADLMGQRHIPLRDLNWSEDASSLVWFVPETRSGTNGDWRETIGVQTTYVHFVPVDPACKANCLADRAQVVWTWDGGVAGSRSLLTAAGFFRACGTTLLPGGDAPARDTLPPRLFTGQDLLIVTLVYRFQPRVLTSLFTAKTLLTQAYVGVPTGRLAIDPLGLTNEVTPCP